MEMMKDMNNDIMENIMSRLDGTALASVACTCSNLRDLAGEESHWKRLCNSAWPSTASKQVDELISSSVAGGFAEFYAASYPMIVYDHNKATTDHVDDQTSSSPGDNNHGLVSLVDVFLNDECVFSRVFDGIPRVVGISDHKLKDTTALIDINLTCDQDRSEELTTVLRLSWILLDKKSGKAVNLSSSNPIFVRRDGPHDGDYLAEFGCILPINQNKAGKCTITARFNAGADCIQAGSLNWRELSLDIEDIEGSELSEEKCLQIFNRTLSSSTKSRNQLKVEEGFRKYEEDKSRTLQQKEFSRKLAGRLFVFIEVAAIVTCSYTLKFLL